MVYKIIRLSVIVSEKLTKVSVRKMLRREIVRLNRINKGALFICDLQEKFRPLIKVVLESISSYYMYSMTSFFNETELFFWCSHTTEIDKR